eukprot:scaffold5966_cov118-Cylindrotheca_fusiformis.AAC.22
MENPIIVGIHATIAGLIRSALGLIGSSDRIYEELLHATYTGSLLNMLGLGIVTNSATKALNRYWISTRSQEYQGRSFLGGKVSSVYGLAMIKFNSCHETKEIDTSA